LLSASAWTTSFVTWLGAYGVITGLLAQGVSRLADELEIDQPEDTSVNEFTVGRANQSWGVQDGLSVASALHRKLPPGP
jgi:hypothetical protein